MVVPQTTCAVSYMPHSLKIGWMRGRVNKHVADKYLDKDFEEVPRNSMGKQEKAWKNSPKRASVWQNEYFCFVVVIKYSL